ncbi:MAG: hypothetical protein C4K58_02165 [Flavobacteriaceae bacterium]|nr:MAG: hypothetical protein C4K58_02165 [Flavobacteriaceae bacterium]
MSSLLFASVSLLSGYIAGKIFGLQEAQSRAIAFEIGIHNSALAIVLAMEILKSEVMAVPSAVYSLLMYPIAALFGFMLSRMDSAKV